MEAVLLYILFRWFEHSSFLATGAFTFVVTQSLVVTFFGTSNCDKIVSTTRIVLSAGIERSWTVADESPGGTETTTILNDISSSDALTTVHESDRA